MKTVIAQVTRGQWSGLSDVHDEALRKESFKRDAMAQDLISAHEECERLHAKLELVQVPNHQIFPEAFACVNGLTHSDHATSSKMLT